MLNVYRSVFFQLGLYPTAEIGIMFRHIYSRKWGQDFISLHFGLATSSANALHKMETSAVSGK